MNAHLIRPPVADLVFQVYGRPLHPELFDILAVRKIRRDDYELIVRITRTGHAITWEGKHAHFTEVAAAHNQPLPEGRSLINYRLRGEQSASLVAPHGISYQMSFQVEVLTPEIFLHIHDEIVADGAKRGLLHHFHAHQRLSLAPIGFVTAETRAGCIFVSTFHTFPDESTVVKSQSLIEQK